MKSQTFGIENEFRHRDHVRFREQTWETPLTIKIAWAVTTVRTKFAHTTVNELTKQMDRAAR